MTIEDHGNGRSIEVEGRSQYVLNPFDPQFHVMKILK